MLELGQVRGRVRELEVADLAEVAVDGLVGDQPLDELVASRASPGRARARSSSP